MTDFSAFLMRYAAFLLRLCGINSCALIVLYILYNKLSAVIALCLVIILSSHINNCLIRCPYACKLYAFAVSCSYSA